MGNIQLHAAAVLVVAISTLFRVPSAAGAAPAAATTTVQLATEYAELLNRLDKEIGLGSEDLLMRSRDIARKLETDLKSLDRSASATTRSDKSVDLLGRRAVHKANLIPLVSQLGETHARLTAASYWVDFATRAEKRAIEAAKSQAEAMDRAEIQRAYAEFEWQIASRFEAMKTLRALRKGWAEVISKNTYSGEERPATPLETRNFVGNLTNHVLSPICVRPPQKTSFQSIHTVDRYCLLNEHRPELDSLKKMVAAELRELADGHTNEVKRIMAGSDEVKKAMAITSLGWWNGAEGRRIVEESLSARSECLKSAGLIALGRMEFTPAALMRLARHDDTQVQIVAVRLAEGYIHDGKACLSVVRHLLQERDKTVRSEAYKGLENLAATCDASPAEILGQLKPVLDNTNEAVVLDAVDWVHAHFRDADGPVAEARAQSLAPLVRHRDERIRLAVRKSLPGSGQ
ncbi:MAG: hypothetical protein FJ276_10265 [Planctomycetes bacterium]|nr:hypothetical protein [Planctomycetota bacterium]